MRLDSPGISTSIKKESNDVDQINNLSEFNRIELGLIFIAFAKILNCVK